MNYQHLLEKASDYVIAYYKQHKTDDLIYHNRKHTEDVVDAAIQIANHYQLNDRDFFAVVAAAWFHDVGYLVTIENHEENGVALADAFFKGHKLADEDIKLIDACIRATKMPQAPSTLPEKIICDADLFHLGMDDFFKKDKQLLEEYNILHHADLGKADWRLKTIAFLEAHQYHTDYCRLLLDATKAKNLETLKAREGKHEKKVVEHEMERDVTIITDEEPAADMNDVNKKKKKEKPEKGIETMFRISSSNHQRLSDMADKKAHIMITVNSIILSAIISLVLRRLNEYGYLLIPSVILLMVSLLAMTFSILSTRPSIPSGVFSRSDIDNKSVNLLFFGNFYKMKLEDFNYGMEKMMDDADFLYGSLIKDLYAQGVVLGRKYHLLRIAYNIFMFGLIIAVVAFIIAAAFFGHTTV